MIVIKKTKAKPDNVVALPDKATEPASMANIEEHMATMNKTLEIIGLMAKDLLDKPKPALVAKIDRDANGKMTTITIIRRED